MQIFRISSKNSRNFSTFLDLFLVLPSLIPIVCIAQLNSILRLLFLLQNSAKFRRRRREEDSEEGGKMGMKFEIFSEKFWSGFSIEEVLLLFPNIFLSFILVFFGEEKGPIMRIKGEEENWWEEEDGGKKLHFSMWSTNCFKRKKDHQDKKKKGKKGTELKVKDQKSHRAEFTVVEQLLGWTWQSTWRS